MQGVVARACRGLIWPERCRSLRPWGGCGRRWSKSFALGRIEMVEEAVDEVPSRVPRRGGGGCPLANSMTLAGSEGLVVIKWA